jgi:predicted dehydrogenase
MTQLNRRAFLKSTSGLVALAALDLANLHCDVHRPEQPAIARVPKGPNERLNVAVIGLGGRSSAHLSKFGPKNNCRITHVCDPDTALAQTAIDRARAANGEGVPDARYVRDLRRIFDDRNVDLVTIATCNHWHSLAAIWAMQAGKDVYVEKPLSHNLSEGRRVVQVGERTGRICQHGSQMRSNPGITEAMAFLHEGHLGKVIVSRGLCYKPRPSIGKVSGPQPIPSTVDYNLWCGPAPMAPLMRTKFHYDWHWNWQTGNGDIGNQDIHEIDLARWALNTTAMPKSVLSIGGRFGYDDDGQTPNTQIAAYDFGPGQPRLIMEVRGLKTSCFDSNGVENVVACERGFLVFPSYTSAIAYDLDSNIIRVFDGGEDALHFNNFIDAVRSRRPQDLHGPVLEGHRSCALLHMANISYRLGTVTPLASRGDDLFNDPDANRAMKRMRQHLVDNEVPLTDKNFVIGRRLSYDDATETFHNDEEANQMLTREYRAPFVVPASV